MGKIRVALCLVPRADNRGLFNAGPRAYGCQCTDRLSGLLCGVLEGALCLTPVLTKSANLEGLYVQPYAHDEAIHDTKRNREGNC